MHSIFILMVMLNPATSPPPHHYHLEFTTLQQCEAAIPQAKAQHADFVSATCQEMKNQP